MSVEAIRNAIFGGPGNEKQKRKQKTRACTELKRGGSEVQNFILGLDKSGQFFQFQFLFANICASKTFFAQERTLATFGTSTRLNFMPLRADESIKTHPISRRKTTHTHTHTHFYFPLVDEI